MSVDAGVDQELDALEAAAAGAVDGPAVVPAGEASTPRPIEIPLGPATLRILYSKRVDGTQDTTVEVLGRTIDGWKSYLEAQRDELVLWGRHLMWRGAAGAIGFTFVASLGAGPWAVTAYAIALIGAGDIALHLDRRDGR